MPVRYAAHRFFVTPVTASGNELVFFTDTGGGTNMIYRHAVDRLDSERRVLDHADRLLDSPMIEVPEVRIGTQAVGSVWFTVRPDPNFHECMSQWMDRRIDGALGGSALRCFRVIVDYPNAIAVFERPPLDGSSQ